MAVALRCESLKTKDCSSLMLAIFLPCVFLVFTLVTILNSRSRTGMIDGVSIVQSNIVNQWSLLFLPLTIILIIASDYRQERQARGYQRLLANNWSFSNCYLAKSIKFASLLLLAHLSLLVVIVLSNLVTTGHVGKAALLAVVLLASSVSSWPLIVINMLLLLRLNPTIVALLNLLAVMGPLFFNFNLSKWFFIDPWTYSSRLMVLLRTQPNGTVLAANSALATDTNFLYPILLMVTCWMVIQVVMAVLLGRRQGFHESN